MSRRRFLAAAAAAWATPALARTPLWQTLPEPVRRVPPRTAATVRVGDTDLYYETYGAGRPLILLHDALGNAGHWSNQVGPLSLERQVVAIDLRGHGRSTRGQRSLSYGQMAEDVFGLMRALRLEKATLVGWGDGAVTALTLAMRHPGWVRDFLMFGGNYDLSGLKSGAEKTDTFAAYVRKAMAEYMALSPAPEFDALFRDLQAMWKREPRYTAKDLRKIRVAATVLYAEHDEIVHGAHAREMARLIPGAQLIVLPGLSHFAPWQDSRRFNQAVSAAI